MIEIRQLTKVFKLSKKQMAEAKTKNPRKTAVDHLDLTAKEGEIYGLLGPNGAGKTTTLRCISTLIRPHRGRKYYVNGHEVRKEPEAVRNCIGFLTSDIKLDDQFDVDYMFRFFGRLHRVPETGDRKEEEKELFTYFGIQEFAGKKIKELSTGMKQKAAIAVSLVHDPDIIIFDEPTKGIDVGAKAEIYRLMEELVAGGKSIIMVSSELPEVIGMSDRVVVMREGKIMGVLNHDELNEEVIMSFVDGRLTMKNVIKKFSKGIRGSCCTGCNHGGIWRHTAHLFFVRLTCLISWTSPLSMVFWLSA